MASYNFKLDHNATLNETCTVSKLEPYQPAINRSQQSNRGPTWVAHRLNHRYNNHAAAAGLYHPSSRTSVLGHPASPVQPSPCKQRKFSKLGPG